MRQDPDFFRDKEPVLVYIAKKLREALKLESILTAEGLDYGVEADHYYGGMIFKSQRVGAFFYVLPEVADNVRQVLRRHGYRPQPPEDESEPRR